jgi:hypothetical protein
MERHPPAAFLAFPRLPRDYTWMVRLAPFLMFVLCVAFLVSSIHVGPATPADYQPPSPLAILVVVLLFFWPFLAWAVLNWVVEILILIKPLALRTLIQRASIPAIELGVNHLWASLLFLQLFCCFEGVFPVFWLTHQFLVLLGGLSLSGSILILEAIGARWLTRRLLYCPRQR